MAGCDANYNFVFGDVGAYGSQSDGGVLNNSEMGRRLKTKTLGTPLSKILPNGGPLMPHYAIGNEAFPIHENIMHLYPGLKFTPEQTHFNYRILTSRWSILRGTIHMIPKNAEKVVLACLI